MMKAGIVDVVVVVRRHGDGFVCGGHCCRGLGVGGHRCRRNGRRRNSHCGGRV